MPDASGSGKSERWKLSDLDKRAGVVHVDPPLSIRLTALDSPYFAPKAEAVRISYAYLGVTELEIESLTLLVAPDATPGKTLTRKPLPIPLNGEFEWFGDVDDAGFDGFINFAGAPYRLQLELKAEGKTLVSNAMLLELVPAAVELRVSNDPSLGLTPAHQEVVDRLCGEMRDGEGRLLLDSPLFKTSSAEMNNLASFTTYQTLWGNGPIVPFLAKVWIKTKTGGKARVPEACKGARLLWDFELDDAGAFGAALGARSPHAEAEAFLRKLASHKATTSSPPGTTAHERVGGLRDAPTPRWQALKTWGVMATSQRGWAAYSTCEFDPGLDADVAVGFVGGRMAGDRHHVTAYVDIDGMLDTTDSAPFDAVEAGFKSNTICLANWRRIEIVANLKSGKRTRELDLDSLRREYEKSAVLVEPVSSLKVVDIQEEWKKHYQAELRKLAPVSSFVKDAAEPEPEDYPVRYRSFGEYRVKSEPNADFFRRLWVRISTFFGAGDRDAYRKKCDQLAYRIYSEVIKKFRLQDQGLTLFKFGADGDHNQWAGSYTGGIAPSIPGYTTRTKSAFLVFDKRRATDTLIHEVGHLVFLAHAPGHFAPGAQPAGVQPAAHDRSDICIMSYATSKNGICGLCLVKLGGWNYLRVKNNGTIS